MAGKFMLGDKAAYSSGGGVPEGDYILASARTQIFQATKQTGANAGPPRLGVMITLLPMSGDEGEKKTQFYSMGSKAADSWQPSDDGTGIVPVEGGPGTPPNDKTNWAVFLDNLESSGLPKGILTDDLSVLDGTWVHMANIPEPEDRKTFAQTGEASQQTGPKTIAVVTEIKDDGKPWEGTGGIPEVKAAGKPNGKPAGKAAVAAKPAVKPASAAKPAAVEVSDDAYTDAVNGISEVLGKSPNGIKRLQLRTSTFKEVNTKKGQTAANAVINGYFNNEDNLKAVLAELGYELKGQDVVAA